MEKEEFISSIVSKAKLILNLNQLNLSIFLIMTVETKQAEVQQEETKLSPLLNVETDPVKWLEFRRNLRENQTRTKELMRDMPPLPF